MHEHGFTIALVLQIWVQILVGICGCAPHSFVAASPSVPPGEVALRVPSGKVAWVGVLVGRVPNSIGVAVPMVFGPCLNWRRWCCGTEEALPFRVLGAIAQMGRWGWPY